MTPRETTISYIFNNYETLTQETIYQLSQKNNINDNVIDRVIYLKLEHTKAIKLAKRKKKILQAIEKQEYDERIKTYRYWLMVWYFWRLRMKKKKEEEDRLEKEYLEVIREENKKAIDQILNRISKFKDKYIYNKEQTDLINK
ncbi:MAG: hypothetical protein PHD37_10785 [Gallionellaceae bacterium]|nr:hypothetical protein [Gallionellaceae bacterium]